MKYEETNISAGKNIQLRFLAELAEEVCSRTSARVRMWLGVAPAAEDLVYVVIIVISADPGTTAARSSGSAV